MNTSTWLILTCLWKHRKWQTTILHWMPERTLDLSTYGCIPSLVISVLASTKNWFHHRPPCSTLVCVGGTSNKSSSDFVHSHELGCTSAIPLRRYHSMCSVA
jgi:hypothetical protein